MKRIYLTVLVALAGLLEVQAQQDPHYTQYMYNMSVVNPAYAGSKDALSMGLLYRKQWVEIEDAPTTGTFFGHSPVGKNVGLGISLINDEIGPVQETNAYGDFSYTLHLGDVHKLAFGLKAGATFHKVGLFTEIGDGHVPDADDPAFAENTSNTFFNLGTGLFFYTDKYYIGASVPNMLKSKHLDYNGREFGSETSHYFLTGGYVFDISENVKLKPFTMLKSAFDAPLSVDASLNTLLYNKLELGVTYRLEDSFGAMVNFMVTPNMRIGYAYDHIISDLDAKTKASHEFMLLYDLNFSKKASSSPRFF